MNQTQRALAVVQIIAEAIRDLGEVPSGHLYARGMNHLSLEQYNAAVDALVHAGVVKKANHLLTWIGPAEGVKVMSKADLN